jgi:alpha-tubulin suppressor-like RCC1 family protein
MQLLLVDNRVKDVQTVTQSLLPGVDCVSVNFENDTYETLIAKIPVKTYESVGIFQENYELNDYQLIQSFPNSVLTNIQIQDPNLDTWSQYKSLISYFKNTLQIKTLDLMGCNIHSSPDWNYVIDYLGKQFQININSSNDNTGSPDFGGNWILESGNQDLIGKYFSNNIEKYQFVLGQASSHTVILKNDGRVYAVGGNSSGQFGNGTTTNTSFPVQVLASANNPLTGVVQVAYGSSHTVFLLNTGSVYAVGNNFNGQLGDGTITNTSFPVQVKATASTFLTGVVQVACGTSYTVFLLSSGAVYAVGANSSGQLGNGTTVPSTPGSYSGRYPVQVLAGPSPGVPLTDVVQIACGASHTVFLRSDGSVYAVGNNANGQLGIGTSGSSVSRSSQVQSLTNVVQVAGGSTHTVFLRGDGSVYAVGGNSSGQLGDGTTVQKTSPVQVKATASTFLTGVVQVACGASYTVFLLNTGSVYAVGSNSSGQLGNGTTTTTATGTYPVQVRATASTFLSSVVQVACGSSHTVFFKSDGTVYAVGNNFNGQLGDGTIVSTTTGSYPVQVLANAVYNLIGGYLITEYNSYYYKNKSTITNTTLATLSYSLLDYLIMGLTPTQLKSSPYDYTDSRFYHQSVASFLITNGYYTGAQMLTGGVTPAQMYSGGVTVQQMLTGGVTFQQMLTGGVTVRQMLTEGVTFQQMIDAGITVQQMFDVGITLQQMYVGGVTVQQMLAMGITLQQMYDSFIYESTNTLTYDQIVPSTTLGTNVDDAIYNIDLTGKNFNYYNLTTNSYTVYNTLRISTNGWLGFSSDIPSSNGKSVQLPLNTLRFFSFDAKSTIKYYFDTNNNLFISAVGGFYSDPTTKLPFTIIIKVLPTGLIQVHYQSIGGLGTDTSKPIIGWTGNNSAVTTDDLFYSTFNGANAFVQGNINGKFLNFDFTTQIQYKGCLTPGQLHNGGITIQQLFTIGITIQQMYNGGVTPAQMFNGGVTVQQMFTSGITPAQMYSGGITVQQMFTSGITPAQMYTGGITPAQMSTGGITIQQMYSGDLTTAQILSYNIYESNETQIYDPIDTSTTLGTNVDDAVYKIDLTGKNFNYYNLTTGNYIGYNTLCISTNGWLGFSSNIVEASYGTNVQLPLNTLRFFSFDAKSTIKYYFDTNNNLFISAVGYANIITNLPFTIIIKVLPTGLIQVHYQSIGGLGTSTSKPIIGWTGNNSAVTTDDIFYSTFNGANAFVQGNINGKFLNFDFTGLNVYMTANTPINEIYTYTSTYGYTTQFIADITSNTASVPPPPAAPTISIVNATSLTRVDPTITISVANSSDTTIKNYSWSIDGTSYTDLIPPQKTSTLTIPATGLTSGSEYTFRIKAINDVGTSDASDGVSATFTMPPPPPAAPTISSVNATSLTRVDPTITISLENSSDTTITNYSWSTDGTNYTVLSPAQKTSTLTIPVNGLTSGQRYTFTIKAINASGSSDPSAGVSATFTIPPLPPVAPVITNITSTGGVTSITFQNPTDTSITNYAYSTSSFIDINSPSGPFTTYTLLSPAQTSSPLTISGLHGVVQIKIKAFNGSYSDESAAFNNWYIYTESLICFKEDTQILTSNGYIPIQELKKGDLVDTYKHGLRPITVIAKQEIVHDASSTRIADKLYQCSKTEYNDLFADLVITGRHSILIDEPDSKSLNKQSYDGKYKIQAYKDSKTTVYDTAGKHMIYNFALQGDDNKDNEKNYSVYANGLLVESCSKKCLQTQTTMVLI